MKNPGIKKAKVSGLIIVSTILLFSSCTTYRDGFIKTLPSTGDYSTADLDDVQQGKKLLIEETKKIRSIVQESQNNKQAVPPSALNRLFENLQNHYCIDSVYHWLYQNTDNDSLRNIAHKRMIGSAVAYHQLFQDNRSMRRVINRGDQAFHIKKKSLLHSQKFLWALPNREIFKRELQDKTVRHSKCNFVSQTFFDKTNTCVYKIAGFMSEIFGRVVAKIHARPEPEKNIPRLMPYLEKWDIIIQKSPKRLTDKFIPGHFGHAAIYMGDSVFIEAIQKGVVISNPFHFAEGGSFLLIRLKEMPEERVKHIQYLLEGQVGKKYDFNFDAGSPDKLTCTELVYFIYDDINWSTKKTAGVFTLCPDDIVRTALESKAFFFPLYFDEEKLLESPDKTFIESLLIGK